MEKETEILSIIHNGDVLRKGDVIETIPEYEHSKVKGKIEAFVIENNEIKVIVFGHNMLLLYFRKSLNNGF